MMDAYNRVYGPGGSSPYFAHDLSYDEYLDFEAEIALFHLISGSPYPHYQHVGNLREYAPGRSLAYDWVERLLRSYSRYYNQPLKTLNWDRLGQTVQERTAFRNAGVSGVLDKRTGRISLSASRGGPVFVTGVGGFAAKSARPAFKVTLKRGQTKTFGCASRVRMRRMKNRAAPPPL